MPLDLESGVRVTCDVGYLSANFSLPGPVCSRLRPDVYATDRQTSDAHHRLMPPGGAIIKRCSQPDSSFNRFEGVVVLTIIQAFFADTF